MADALLWGASGGLGRAVTAQLVASGWRVFAAARNPDAIPDGVFDRYRFRAESQATIRDVVIDVAQQTTGLDFWLYAAGSLEASLLRQMAPDGWTAVMDANLNGAFLTISQSVHLLNEGAQAVFIGAYIDHLILPKMGAYAAAKAGLESLVDVLQKEHRKLNFTLVKPGAVDTPFWQNAPFRLPASAKAPETVATAILDWSQAGQRGQLEL